jgi:D-alanine-D-alanine ligase
VVANALHEAGHDILLIYINRAGLWYLNPDWQDMADFTGQDLAGWTQCALLPSTQDQPLLVRQDEQWQAAEFDVDCYLPTIHGMYGEDGTLQGVFELANVPYTGVDVLGAALGVDKAVQKELLKAYDVPLLDYCVLHKHRYQADQETELDKIQAQFSLPLFVKPARLGSSIGISQVTDFDSLQFALELAFTFDNKVIIEEGVQELKEINVALLGNHELIVSKTEEPLTAEQFLTFTEKYITGGGTIKQAVGDKVKVPAEIPEQVEQQVLHLARTVFSALQGRGISRIDFIYDLERDQVYFNEINSFPGTMQVGLWKKSGLEPSQVVDKLLTSAQESWQAKNNLKRTFESSILEKSGGVKKY